MEPEIGQLTRLTNLRYPKHASLVKICGKLAHSLFCSCLLKPFISSILFLFVCSIRENQITQLPASIGQLRQLASLDCSYNQLEHLPAQLGECRQLVQLDLQHNKLIDLPPEIGNLTQLARLGLRYTNIFCYPANIFMLPGIFLLSSKYFLLRRKYILFNKYFWRSVENIIL